jgi:hypothetical protein
MKIQLYIINEFDGPCPKNIAEKRMDGKFYYIHPSVRNIKVHHGMQPKNPTLVEDFGIELEFKSGRLFGYLTKESIATYGNNKTPRSWQGAIEFSFPCKHKPRLWNLKETKI